MSSEVGLVSSPSPAELPPGVRSAWLLWGLLRSQRLRTELDRIESSSEGALNTWKVCVVLLQTKHPQAVTEPRQQSQHPVLHCSHCRTGAAGGRDVILV